MDSSDQEAPLEVTAFACIQCHRVVLGIKNQAPAEFPSIEELKKGIEWFRTTTCESCRRDIILTPASPQTGFILLPGRELPVAQEAIAGWICYTDLCDYLGRRPKIYQLENWCVIENLFRLKDGMGHESTVFTLERQEEAAVEFFTSQKPWKLEDKTRENTKVDNKDDACLGCIQCPAILPILRRHELSDIWFRLTTCRQCRQITVGRSLCPIGEVPIGLDFLKALPSFSAATNTLGKSMKLVKTQGFYVVESHSLLVKEYSDRIDGGEFF